MVVYKGNGKERVVEVWVIGGVGDGQSHYFLSHLGVTRNR